MNGNEITFTYKVRIDIFTLDTYLILLRQSLPGRSPSRNLRRQNARPAGY